MKKWFEIVESMSSRSVIKDIKKFRKEYRKWYNSLISRTKEYTVNTVNLYKKEIQKMLIAHGIKKFEVKYIFDNLKFQIAGRTTIPEYQSLYRALYKEKHITDEMADILEGN